MNALVRRRINELAQDVLLVFDISSPIKDMKSAVKKLKGTIVEEENLGQFSDGLVKKETGEDYNFSIHIPRYQSEARKNFTIAHELGHLFLHMGYVIDNDLWEHSDEIEYNRRGNSEVELEANEFAAAFLMPEKEYVKVMDEFSNGDTVLIGKVAEHFNVSIDAASYRGKWLGYLRW